MAGIPIVLKVTMMRLLKVTIAMCLVPVGCAQTQAPTVQSSEAQEVKTAVEKFYKLEAAGAWLRPERWDELHDFLSDIEPWSPPSSVSVLKGYLVGDAKKIVDADGTVRYSVDVKCYVWGSINSFLRFTNARATGEPVEQGAGGDLLLTDSFVLARPSGNQEKRKGALRWRTRYFTPLNLANEDAAIRWVAEMRDKSNDPAIKHNAAKTLEILRSLSAGRAVPSPPAGIVAESPSKVAQ